MKRLVFGFALLTACGGGSAPAGAAPSAATAAAADAPAASARQAEARPCTVPVPANTGEWKRVEGTGISFCVPAAWRVSSTRASYAGGNIRWQYEQPRAQVRVVGGPPGMSSTSIANAGSSSAGTTMARRLSASEMIGGQMATIWSEEGTGRVGTGASFRDPPLNFTGEASGQENVQLQLAVYRTIRFTR